MLAGVLEDAKSCFLRQLRRLSGVQAVESSTSAAAGGECYSDPHPTVTSDAVVPVDPPVPICPFQGEDPVQGTPLSLDDLLGDFAVVVTVDAKDPEVAQQVLDRLLQVIEGIGARPFTHPPGFAN